MPAQVSWCGFCSKRGTPNLGSPKSFIMGSIYPLPQREVLSLSLWTVNRPYHCSVSGDNASVFQGCLLCRILKQIACCKGRHCFCSQARKECKRLLENHLPTAGFIACILIRLRTESRRNSAVTTAFSAVMSKPVMCCFEEPVLPLSPARAPSRSLCLP